jgi:dihydroorotate dehydrogenase electron transfer subunit
VLQFEAEILGNRPVAESWRELVLAWDARAGGPAPGQFFTFRAARSSDPLLRRPLAFSGFAAAEDGAARATAIYQARGAATRILADLAPGAMLDVIGPLGRPFPLPLAGEVPIVAGGGIGLGPLLFLDARLREAGAEPTLVLGFRGASYLPSVELPAGTVICTDDGSAGERGTPVDWISRNAPPPGATPPPGAGPRLYACGPGPMLAALAALAAERSWPAWFSAEQWMACGVGACMGCALPRADGAGYLRACADGPVFAASEIAWGAGR